MKNPILLLLLFCSLTLNSTAQSDTLQRYLVKQVIAKPVTVNQDSFVVITPYIIDVPPYYEEFPWIIPYPYEPYPIIDWGTISVYCVLMPTCGDTYHDNGLLASRIDCKDSVLHGLATYWNEDGVKTSETNYVDGLQEGKSLNWSPKGIKTMEANYVNGKLHGKVEYWSASGHKTSDYTYAYGRMFKQKIYGDYSKIESIEHYTYNRPGDQLMHGTCTYYNGTDKEVSRYDNGKLEGVSQWFENGIKVREKIYEYDYLQDDKTWNTNGQLITHGNYSRIGKLEHLQEWDKNGVLIKEQFKENDRCKGIWMSYYPPTDSKTLTYYSEFPEPAKILKKEVYSEGKLVQHYGYTNNMQTDIIYYYPNGNKQFHTHSELKQYDRYMAWTENNELTDSMTYVNHTFIGNGFYTDGDTLFNYVADKTVDASPIKRWVILDGDTLRQDYVINSSTNRNQVLQRNYYAKNNAGISVRSGVWSFYTDNTISHALTYANGDITGRAVYYTQKEDMLVVTEYGYYSKGIKHGKWTTLNSLTQQEYNYQNGELNGTYYKLNADYDTLISANYNNNELNGSYLEYTRGILTINGYYTNGVKSQFWEYHNADGNMKESGFYENDQRIGKWLLWYTNDKGKRKKRKINYDKEVIS